MLHLPRPAAIYLLAVGVTGGLLLVWVAPQVPLSGSVLAQAAFFVSIAVLADLKQLRLETANYSVATATNFACAIVLGPAVGVWVSAIGAAIGDIALRKPPHKIAFNAAAVSLSVYAGGRVMDFLRVVATSPQPADLPSFLGYALAHSVTNVALVSTIIALATRTPIWRIVAGNHGGFLVPIMALYPLGLLMAVVYTAFGGWLGLLLLVVPVIAVYAAIERARQLLVVNEKLRESAHANAELYQQANEAHTRLMEVHAQLKQAQEQIVEQERLHALGRMASGIAHDFNNALSPVVGFTELLLLQPAKWSDEAYVRRHLECIHRSAVDAANVVRQLREFYRKTEDTDQLLPLDLNLLIRQVVEMTQPKWRDQALASGITIRVTTECETIPPILGDESSLREALTNLIFNAVDAMPTGGLITIRTLHVAPETGERVDSDQTTSGREAFGANGAASRGLEVGRAVVEVVDTGTGMTEEIRRRCLDPFFTTKGPRGTGLGLSMVHGIMRRHGGILEVESAWGVGTTVRLEVPECASRQAVPAEDSAVEVESSIGQEGQRTLRVLIVDDEPSVREMLAAYLASYGCASESATNGLEGLDRFRNGQYDLVVTDRAMPDMNGDLLAQAIKETCHTVPVIMLTGFGDMITALDEKPSAVDLVLSKPIRRDDLRRALERVVVGRV